MVATFSEFDAEYARQYQNDGQGWYEACVTMDGRTRLRRSVRVCSESFRRLGETVRNGNDGRMGSDVRRWPQSLFDASLQGRSPVARICLHKLFTAAPTDDRTITHIRRLDGGDACVYRGMPSGIPLRWRFDPDGLHMQTQLSRQVNNASEWRQHLVEIGRPDLLKLVFPTDSGDAYPIAFADANALPIKDVIAALSPRPQVYRIPLMDVVSPKDSTSRRGTWTLIDTPSVVHSGETTTIDGVDVTWCALTGQCRLKTFPLNDVKDLLPITGVRRDERGAVNADCCDKRVSWHDASEARAPTLEELRQHIVRMCTPSSLKTQLSSPCQMEHTVNARDDGHVVRRVKATDSAGDHAVRLTSGRYALDGAGMLFPTDEALSSGFPHTHASDRTFSLDAKLVDADHENDADYVCRLQTQSTSKIAMLALLDGLSKTQNARFVVAETDDPVWRAQLAAILKMAPIRGDDTPPELRRCLSEQDQICLSPDERMLRVRHRDLVLPILMGKDMSTLVAPAFDDANAFRGARVSLALIDELLLSVDADRNAVDVQLRLDPSAQTLYALSGDTWKNDTIFGFRRRRWMNCLRPIGVSIDTFRELPHPLYGASASFLINTTTGDTGVVDNCACRDHRTLALPEHAAYASTGRVAPNIMIRPFPSTKDIATMRSFCASSEADPLF